MLGNRTNPAEAAALGREAIRAGADRFAAECCRSSLVERLGEIVDASQWALVDENELVHSIERFIIGPRRLDYIFSSELDLIKALLDDPKQSSGLVRNEDAMRRLMRDRRPKHHAVAGGWGNELRERDRATDRLLGAIDAGKVDSDEIVRMISRLPSHKGSFCRRSA